MRLSFDEAGELLDRLAETFPKALFQALNGGVNLLEEAQPDPEFPKGKLYIMGEYCTDLLGRYINLYYGSFAALSEQEAWTAEDWAEELRITLSHELTHHMEDLSGLHGLDDRDDADMARYREQSGLQ